MAASDTLAVTRINPVSARLSQLKKYYYLTKPGIVYSNLATAVSGYVFASDWHIKWVKLLYLTGGTALIIASSCVFNNVLDRSLDAKMARTRIRALVTETISVRAALAFASAMLIAGLGLLTRTNPMTFVIGVLAVISYVLIYG